MRFLSLHGPVAAHDDWSAWLQRAAAGLAGLVLAMLAETTLLIMRTSYPMGVQKELLQKAPGQAGHRQQQSRSVPLAPPGSAAKHKKNR